MSNSAFTQINVVVPQSDNPITTTNVVTASNFDLISVRSDADRFNVTLNTTVALPADTKTAVTTQFNTPSSLPEWTEWDAATGGVTILEDGYYQISVNTTITTTGMATEGSPRVIFLEQIAPSSTNQGIEYGAALDATGTGKVDIVRMSIFQVIGATAKLQVQAQSAEAGTLSTVSWTIRRILGASRNY